MFQVAIAQRHALKEADNIPSWWRSVSKVDALKNLRQKYVTNEEMKKVALYHM